MMKFCKDEMTLVTVELYHLYFFQIASYQLRMSGTICAKVPHSYFRQNKLELIQSVSVNVHYFFKKDAIILSHGWFISGTLPHTIPLTRLFNYKSRCRPVAGVVERIGLFKGYIVSIKKCHKSLQSGRS